MNRSFSLALLCGVARGIPRTLSPQTLVSVPGLPWVSQALSVLPPRILPPQMQTAPAASSLGLAPVGAGAVWSTGWSSEGVASARGIQGTALTPLLLPVSGEATPRTGCRGVGMGWDQSGEGGRGWGGQGQLVWNEGHFMTVHHEDHKGLCSLYLFPPTTFLVVGRERRAWSKNTKLFTSVQTRSTSRQQFYYLSSRCCLALTSPVLAPRAPLCLRCRHTCLERPSGGEKMFSLDSRSL